MTINRRALTAHAPSGPSPPDRSSRLRPYLDVPPERFVRSGDLARSQTVL